MDDTSRERVNVATLKNVVHAPTVTMTDREKRLSVIEEPMSTASQISNNRIFTSCDENQSPITMDDSLHC